MRSVVPAQERLNDAPHPRLAQLVGELVDVRVPAQNQRLARLEHVPFRVVPENLLRERGIAQRVPGLGGDLEGDGAHRAPHVFTGGLRG